LANYLHRPIHVWAKKKCYIPLRRWWFHKQ
jgi:hypothetical protein